MEIKKGFVRVRIGAIIIENDSILLVHHQKDDRDYWLLPGGGLEASESIEECIKREMLEETGYDVKPGKLVFTSETLYPGRERHIIHMNFLAEITGRTNNTLADERIIGHKFIPLSEFMNYKFYPNIKAELIEAAKNNFNQGAVHLGLRWE
ncbi:MAG: NUDIX domain-containing protein [Candidatus Wallbacteria bacterium]